MSDKPEGPGWWIASDGKWYPPELHPSVREGSRMHSPVDTPVQPAVSEPAQASQPARWHGNTASEAPVGPQFPDLFQKALQGSHLVDNVTVMNGFDDEAQSASRSGTRGGTPVGAAAGPSSRRRWRKGS
jgi:hypothetical protein